MGYYAKSDWGLGEMVRPDQRAAEVIDRMRAMMKRHEDQRSLVEPDVLANEM